ncbi:hypothetical protein [Catenuloplanes japonicus]|uniref:hypothetical protein n=1 Tax=Catenuloplanes japonicus TaxID=33876 RepID=UPI0005247ADE|nr:hypothetical protein [Catenuloplanes japonicus]
MSRRGFKLDRFRRMLGGGVPAAGVTRVSRPSGRASGMDDEASAEAREGSTALADDRIRPTRQAPPAGGPGGDGRAARADDQDQRALQAGDGRAPRADGPARRAAEEEPDTPTTAVDGLGAGDSHGRSRTGKGFGSYRGVHRKAAA